MTKQEFENRTGFHIPDVQWEMVNEMYMNAGDHINKDTFCDDYSAHRGSILLHTYYDKMLALMKELKDMQYKLNSAARVLRVAAAEYGDMEFRKEAVKLIGERAAVLYALKDLTLSDEDMRYIEDNLK